MEIDDAFWGFGRKTIAANPPGHLGGRLGVSTWTNVRGDTPPNFGATTFVSGAYLLTGEPKYRQWVEGYIGAWCERAAKNESIFPANVGLSGIVGEHWHGQWWRHMHGTWSMAYFRSILTGIENAVLLSGNDQPPYTWRLDMPLERRDRTGTRKEPYDSGGDHSGSGSGDNSRNRIRLFASGTRCGQRCTRREPYV